MIGERDWMDYGPSPGAMAPEIIVNTSRDSLGAGHYMETNAKFTRPNGVAAGCTTTETITWLGGFHGGVYGILADASDIPVPGGQSPLFRFGVDGTAIGISKRTDAWTFAIDPNQAANVSGLRIFHVWVPDQFQVILNRWVAAGQSVAQLAQQAATVAKVFSSSDKSGVPNR